MKTTLFILASFVGLFFVSCSNTEKSGTDTSDSTKVETTQTVFDDSKPDGARYGVKSGIVYYEPYEMMGMKMTQTTYFDDYGKKETQEILTEGEMMGMKTKSHAMNILADGYSISFEVENIVNGKNQTKKIARKSKISGAMGMDMAALTDELKKKYDYKEEGTETVAGIEGTKFSMTFDKGKSNTRISGVVYENIMLRSEANIGGMKLSLKASKFDKEAAVPATIFEVPAGYTIEEVDLSKMGQPLETK
jgi:hypothetical protein